MILITRECVSSRAPDQKVNDDDTTKPFLTILNRNIHPLSILCLDQIQFTMTASVVKTFNTVHRATVAIAILSKYSGGNLLRAFGIVPTRRRHSHDQYGWISDHGTIDEND